MVLFVLCKLILRLNKTIYSEYHPAHDYSRMRTAIDMNLFFVRNKGDIAPQQNYIPLG